MRLVLHASKALRVLFIVSSVVVFQVETEAQVKQEHQPIFGPGKEMSSNELSTSGKKQAKDQPDITRIVSTSGLGGPDAFGYRWIDSDQLGGPPFSWSDISFSGTALDSASAWVPTGTFRRGDEGYYPVQLPFAFTFYGVPKDSIFIGTNGNVMFQRPTGDMYNNVPFPTVGGNIDDHIGVFWDDMEVRAGARVYFGLDFRGNFVVQYQGMALFGQAVQDYTFEILLSRNGHWTIQYLNMGINGGTLSSATVGMENAIGTIGLTVVHNAPYVHNNLAIRFTPPNSSLSWDGEVIDANWYNPSQWDPNIVPTLYDSATVKRGTVSAEIQTYSYPSVAVAAVCIRDTGVVRFNNQGNGIFAVTRSLQIEATGLFQLGTNDTLSVGKDINLNGGILDAAALSATGNAIRVGQSWFYQPGSIFLPGRSTVFFNGKGIFSGPFYNIVVSDTMTSAGNVIDSNQVNVQGMIKLRIRDTLVCVQSNNAEIIGSGNIVGGTIARAIGSAGRYRFESDSTYLLFSSGPRPSRIHVTTFPDSLPPNGNFLPLGGQVFPDGNTIRVVGTNAPYRKWAIGIPRLNPSAPPQLLKRVYDISATGNTSAAVTLSLRYEESELQPGMDENSLILFYYDPQAPAQTRASVKVFLEGPFASGPDTMATTLRRNNPAFFGHFPQGFPIPSKAVDSITIQLRPTANWSSATIRTSQPAWLLSDGTITSFYDSVKNYVEFDTTAGNYYIVVRHRNHLAIMTANAQALSSTTPVTAYDFTTAQSQAYGTEPMKLVGVKYCMYSGDGDASGGVNAADRNLIWRSQNGSLGYIGGDFNLSGGANAADRNLYWRPNNGIVTQAP